MWMSNVCVCMCLCVGREDWLSVQVGSLGITVVTDCLQNPLALNPPVSVMRVRSCSLHLRPSCTHAHKDAHIGSAPKPSELSVVHKASYLLKKGNGSSQAGSQIKVFFQICQLRVNWEDNQPKTVILQLLYLFYFILFNKQLHLYFFCSYMLSNIFCECISFFTQTW